MKKLLVFGTMALGLTACGSDEKTTVIREQPVIVQQPATPIVINR